MSWLLFFLLFVFFVIIVLFVSVLIKRIYPSKCNECEKRKQQDNWARAAAQAPPPKVDEESDVE